MKIPVFEGQSSAVVRHNKRVRFAKQHHNL